MTAFRIIGRSVDVPADWQAQLAARLGEKPRRLGLWTELALFGALRCLDDANEKILPQNAGLRLCTLNGASSSLQNTLAEARAGFLPPFGFLQCQASITLATLAAHLSWRGDAVSYVCRDDVQIAQLVCREKHEAGVLIGWVEETPALRCDWVRLVPNKNAGAVEWQPALSRSDLLSPHVTAWRLHDNGIYVAGGASHPS